MKGFYQEVEFLRESKTKFERVRVTETSLLQSQQWLTKKKNMIQIKGLTRVMLKMSISVFVSLSLLCCVKKLFVSIDGIHVL